MYQGGLFHEPYFIAINIKGQAPNKKIVAIYIIGELTLLNWFMGTWKLKRGYCYDQYLIYIARTRAKDNNDIIGYAVVVSVSASCNRCCFITLSS